MTQKRLEKIITACEDFQIRMRHLLIGIGAGHALTSQYYGEPLYHASGFLASAVALALDHTSTFPIIKLMNTTEFEQRGLKGMYQETNPFIGPHPTMKRYITIAVPDGIIKLALGCLFPPVSYAFLSFTPVVYLKNRNVREDLELSLNAETIEIESLDLVEKIKGNKISLSLPQPTV
ncbi:hypothetical protein J4234_06970 [Candidatus Woesearchaeota archaeon]|nr:hypothetical protein [Candidatus Woesearchaeota archaeon]